MADNYLQFSETLDNLTKPEADWLAGQLECIAVTNEKTYPLDELPDDVAQEDLTYRGPRFLADGKQIDRWGGEPDFCWCFRDKQEHFRRGRHLWLYSEGYGSIDQVVCLVRKFLKRFRPNDVWTLTYAATCSKPRVGEFGGGAVIVTAKRVTWHDSGAIAAKAVKRLELRTVG
jgi:hypothetical protein